MQQNTSVEVRKSISVPRKFKVSPIPVVSLSPFRSPYHKINTKIDRKNLISIPVRSSCSPSNISEPLLVACFNAHSVGAAERRTEIANFVVNRNVDILFITESWLRESGDEAKLCDLSPAGYSIRSFPRLSRGGGIAVLAKKNTFNCLTFSTKS